MMSSNWSGLVEVFEGYDAITYAELHDMLVSKHADPTEDEALLDPAVAREVADEDPSLIYLNLGEWYQPIDRALLEAIAEYRTCTDSPWLKIYADKTEHKLAERIAGRQRLAVRQGMAR